MAGPTPVKAKDFVRAADLVDARDDRPNPLGGLIYRGVLRLLGEELQFGIQ
jgi:hypothetical protein